MNIFYIANIYSSYIHIGWKELAFYASSTSTLVEIKVIVFVINPSNTFTKERC